MRRSEEEDEKLCCEGRCGKGVSKKIVSKRILVIDGFLVKDALMKVFQRVSSVKVALVRASVEISVCKMFHLKRDLKRSKRE